MLDRRLRLLLAVLLPAAGSWSVVTTVVLEGGEDASAVPDELDIKEHGGAGYGQRVVKR